MADINAIIAQGFDPGKVIQPFIDAPKNALAMKMAQSQLAGNESENALRKAQIGKIDKEQEQQAQLQTYAKMAQISQKHAADVQRDPANLKLHNASAKMMAERMGVGQYWQDAATKEQALQDDAALQQQFAALFAATNGDAYGSPIQTVDNGKTVATSISKVPGIPDRTTDIKGNPASVENAGTAAQARMDAAYVAAANRGLLSDQSSAFKEQQLQLQKDKFELDKQKQERAASGISPRTLDNARSKMQAISAIRQQLAKAKEIFNTKLKNSMSAGAFGQGKIPSQAGNEFDKSIAMIQPLIRQLTRTPGEGAMSDYESKLAAAIMPSRGDYEATTSQQFQDVEDLISNLEYGYTGILSDANTKKADNADSTVSAPADQGRTSAGNPPEHDAEMEQLMKMAKSLGILEGQ